MRHIIKCFPTHGGNCTVTTALTGFTKVLQDGVDVVESFIDFLTHLGASQYDLTRNKDQQNDPRFHHAIDEAPERVRVHN